MRRYAALIACFLWIILYAASVRADPQRITGGWGGLDSASTSVVTLAPCHSPRCYATVTYRNFLNGTGDHRFTLDLPEGFEVTVEIEGDDSHEPDILRVIPPVGFVAEPPSVSIPDGETDTIYIRLMEVS